MMQKRYRAAIAGQGGMFNALKRLWANRFSSIKTIILVPAENEKLELTISWNARQECDFVTLKRTNWTSGQESILYQGPLTNGHHVRPRALRD